MNTVKPLGVILCGGQSARMGVDKCEIDYHGKPQKEHLKSLLNPFCRGIVVSTGNTEVKEEDCFSDLPEYKDHGPISGLLSLFHFFPDRDLLVVGGDYPLLQTSTLLYLLSSETNSPILAFQTKESKQAEPLIALYRKEAYPLLLEAFRQGEDSLRRIIKSLDIPLIEAPEYFSLMSADRPEDSLRVREIIRSGKLTFA
ncbi:MAG: molybdenum cofactor guanylyltransferase [Bacteroidetes bacterium]|nr:MAG: molybdenum cofactor guanylyltransferase [Bacteroidota bacterium]